MNLFRFLYQDESGDVGRGQPHFIVGLLMVREREPLWAAIKRARDRWHYANEMHFEKVSNLRIKVFQKVVLFHAAFRVRIHDGIFHTLAAMLQQQLVK